MGNSQGEVKFKKSAPSTGSLSCYNDYFRKSPLNVVFDSSDISPQIESPRKKTPSELNPEDILGLDPFSAPSTPRIMGRLTPLFRNHRPSSSFTSIQNQSLSSPRSNLSSLPITIDSSSILRKNMKEFLQEYIGDKEPKVLFDSKTQGFDGRELKSSICCQRDLLFVFECENERFGFYHKGLVSHVSPNGTLSVDSEEMYLFAINDQLSQPHIYKRKNSTKKSFTLHPSNSGLVLTCFSAFWIDSKAKISFNFCVRDCYKIENKCANPFSLKQLNEKMGCDRFVVLGCNSI